MAKVEFTPYILREAADIYSFRIEGEKESEFGKFLVMFKTLRIHICWLYFIRLSDKLLILGNGGIKRTRTYQEDKWLKECVKTLQKIDKELMDLEECGVVLEDKIMNINLEL